MPMWTSWQNPRMGEHKCIYNYSDPHTEERKLAVRMTRRCLSQEFNTPRHTIPGFHVEMAPWLPPHAVRSQQHRNLSRRGGLGALIDEYRRSRVGLNCRRRM